MRGGVFPGDMPEAEARELIEAEPSMAGRDLAAAVTPAEPIAIGEGDGPRVVGDRHRHQASIVRNLRERGVRLDAAAVHDERARRCWRAEPDAVFLANGPGDPAALDTWSAPCASWSARCRCSGICLGHQLLCRAVGLETFKLPFGHRGANHPVKDLATGKIEITAQNHGFAVVGPGGERTLDDDEPVRWETDFGAAELSHLNLYDRTVEGLVLRDVPGACVQYHPEAGPGPHDSLYLFDRFLEMVAHA